MRPARRRTTPVLAAAVAFAIASLAFILTSDRPEAFAVEPGVNCASYADGVCVITVGETWFCEALYQDSVCPTSIVAGDTIRWEYPSSGLQVHTTTECGANCDSPTTTPLWDSDLLYPGSSFEITLTTPGQYLYYCWVHPLNQRGLIRVLEPPSTPALTGTPTSTPTRTPMPSPTPTRTNTPMPTRTPTPAGRPGDVNCDNNVTAIDAALVLQFDAGLLRSLRCPQNGDLSRDGRINSLDAALILQRVAGLIR